MTILQENQKFVAPEAGFVTLCLVAIFIVMVLMELINILTGIVVLCNTTVRVIVIFSEPCFTLQLSYFNHIFYIYVFISILYFICL